MAPSRLHDEPDGHRVPSSTLQREPTRLETRTKECNYDASHWVANPKAQRK
jgi:hypothetical protein